MSGDVVARAKDALKGVTAGPWSWVFRDFDDGAGDLLVSDTARTRYEGGMTWGGETHYATPVVASYAQADGAARMKVQPDDADFIAAARTLVPELLAEIERLRGALAGVDAQR